MGVNEAGQNKKADPCHVCGGSGVLYRSPNGKTVPRREVRKMRHWDMIQYLAQTPCYACRPVAMVRK